MAHSSASSNSNFVIAHDLRRDRERKENKFILATCGIWKDFHLQGGKFVGTGSLVQGLFLKFEEKIHLVTSNKVISPNDYLRCYYLYFKKSKDEEKERVRLDKMASNEVIFKSGLAIVLIDPKKLGFIRQYTSGFVNHRPFTIRFKVKEDLRNDELYCHVAEESGESIAIRPYKVKGIADEETYVTDHSSIKIESTSFCSSHRKGLGAPIAITVKDEAVAVGAITLSNNKHLSFVLFSQIDRKRAFSDEGNGGGGEQQAPGEPAEGEEQQPPREPAGGEEQQPPGEQDGQNLNIGVGVAHMAPSDPNAYSKTEREVLCKVAENYLVCTPPRNREERNEFEEHLKNVGTLITGLKVRSLVITVKCDSLKSLEELWKEYSCGLLGKMVQDCFVTEKILKELNLAELKLKTTMDLEEYNAYKLYFLEKDALKGASSSEFHSISSTSESLQNQEELKKWEQKTKIVETEKRKGMLPLLGSSTSDSEESEVESFTSDSEEEPEDILRKLQIMKGSSSPPLLSTTDLEEKLRRVCEHLKMLRVEGGFPVLQFSTVDLEEKLDELYMEFQRLRMEGTLPPPELFTADLEDELKVLRSKLNRVRMKGRSHPLVSTIEVKLGELIKQLRKWRKEGSFPVLKFSTIYLGETLAELSDQLQRLRMEGTLPSPELLTADLEEKLKELLTELERQRDKGSLPPTFSTIEVEVDELLKKFQKWRIEGALTSEFHSTSSTSESPLTKEQWEKSEQQTKIMETAKLEGTSPLIVIPTTGHGKELEEPWGRKGMLPLPGSSTFDLEEELEELHKKLQITEGSLHSLPTTDLKEKLKQVFEEICKLRMEGSFSALKLSTIDLEKKLAELRMKLQRLRMEGTLPPPELFTADLEDELEQLEHRIWITERKIEKGSSHSFFGTIYAVYKLRPELKKVKMEALENAMYPTIRSGLAKFDVSLPVELQNYVSYLLNESAKLHFRKQVLQPPRALEELREAMDKDELIAFLTIHIREGAWQVVLLFTDELPRVKLLRDWCHIIHNEDEDEEVSNEVIYSSKSGILNGWPTEYDLDLITLCKAITNRDWKVTRLILSRGRISDEGLKNLSTALPQSELYSLTLYGNDLQSQGLKHLCEALISSDCHLTTLNVSHNMLGDEGIMHLRDALASVHCRLTTLNVSHNRLGDEGIVLLSNAQTSVNCRLTTLNVSHNKFGDEGIMHLCSALTSVNCRLTSLNVSDNRWGDEGIVYLCNTLTSIDCTLTSLNVSGNKFGDEGMMHLCNALTSVNCRLTSLNVSRIRWGDNGIKHLCDALTSSNCVLTKLEIGSIRLGDGGIKELSGALTNGFCTLTSLDLSGNEFGDEGIKHLCKALTDTNCKLRSLDYHENRNVTDEGEKYLSQMLTGTDWEVRGAQLSRSTTK